jgi:23S rRNA pseudouridine2605 synthase
MDPGYSRSVAWIVTRRGCSCSRTTGSWATVSSTLDTRSRRNTCRVDGTPSERQIARLRRGVELDDGPATPKSARIVASSGGRGAVRLVMTEGRKREVRRLLAAVGLPVTRLVRLRIGSVRLGRLAPGAIRELTPEEVHGLSRAAGM